MIQEPHNPTTTLPAKVDAASCFENPEGWHKIHLPSIDSYLEDGRTQDLDT